MINTSNHKKALLHLKNVDSQIYAVAKLINYDEWFLTWEDMRNTQNFFSALCRIIVGQQLSTKVAKVIYKRFEDAFEGELSPKKVLAKPDIDLRTLGLSNAKVKYVKDLAQKVHNGELKLNKLLALSDMEVTEELTKVKGIGTWSADMFLMFNMGRENVFSFKDLGLLRGIEKVYELKDPKTEVILEIIEKWSPYKSYGSIALWHSLDKS